VRNGVGSVPCQSNSTRKSGKVFTSAEKINEDTAGQKGGLEGTLSRKLYARGHPEDDSQNKIGGKKRRLREVSEQSLPGAEGLKESVLEPSEGPAGSGGK